jgi:hypothetical protein
LAPSGRLTISRRIDFDTGRTHGYLATPIHELTTLNPAKVWVGLKNSDAVGLRLDLLAEVFLHGTKVGEGQLCNVASGSSGFHNAKLNNIDLTRVAGRLV